MRTVTDPELADEHAELLMQVASRAEALLAEVEAGRWPAQELQALLGYLRAELLRQVVDEEQLLFPDHGAPAGLARLAGEHARLRARIEALEDTPAGGRGSRTRLARAVRDLVRQIEDHLATEEAVLGASEVPGTIPATTALGGHPHEWYPLTEGPVIDLDALSPGEATDAAVDRVLRLHRGEQVELRSASDPYPVWQRIDELAAGRYGFAYLEDGPRCWRLQVTRREEE
jgi:uncharacterized protein (DUF2249 family)